MNEKWEMNENEVGSSYIPSCFVLQKPELNAGGMGRLRSVCEFTVFILE